jgi:ankyrin repeat protein
MNDIEKKYRKLFLDTRPDKESKRLAFMDEYDTVAYFNELKDYDDHELDGYAIHYATFDNHYYVLDGLINLYGVNVNVKTKYGYTALHLATTNLNCMTLLLNAGADVNATNCGDNTPLHLAVLNVNAFNIRGNTPLHSVFASAYTNVVNVVKQYECAELLIKAGADPNITNYSGHSVYTLAKNNGYSTIELDRILK